MGDARESLLEESLDEKTPYRMTFGNKLVKKIIATGMGLSMVVAVPFMNPQKVEAYNFNTQTIVAKHAKLAVENDKGSVISRPLNKVIESRVYYDSKGHRISDKTTAFDIILKNCRDGSINRKEEGTLKRNFYDPRTGVNYKGGNDTANSRLCDNYNKAVRAYQSGNEKEAYAYLGEAEFYLGLVNSPHHVDNQPVSTKSDIYTSHEYYEKKVDSRIDNYTITSVPDEYYNYALNNDIARIGYDCANEAKALAPLVQNGNEKKSELRNRVMLPTLTQYQRMFAALIVKFYNDVGVYRR